jgi:hypothetical protein
MPTITCAYRNGVLDFFREHANNEIGAIGDGMVGA